MPMQSQREILLDPKVGNAERSVITWTVKVAEGSCRAHHLRRLNDEKSVHLVTIPTDVLYCCYQRSQEVVPRYGGANK